MPQHKKKKQPQDAFHFFMFQFRNQEEEQGARCPVGLKKVAKKAAPSLRLQLALCLADRLHSNSKMETIKHRHPKIGKYLNTF
jgi:hypothetical protein